MAYARRGTRRSASRGRGYSRAAPRRAAAGRRRSTGRAVNSRGVQTVRVVVETMPANAVTRPGMFTQVPQVPSRKARL